MSLQIHTYWLIIVLSLLLILGEKHASAQSNRLKQLDSLVTNLDRKTLKNLDSLHVYLHNFGANDFERAFLYFGLISTHYRYDFERKRKRKVKEYTPYYTAYRRTGVCRDFAALYKELCERSNIPCVIAHGRAKVPFHEGIKDFFLLKLGKSNHAWNIVKYDNEWHLMDPTWGSIYKTEKYYSYDSLGRRSYKGKVKIVNRNYFDISSENLYSKRNALHPALYINSTVYSHKTSRKKLNKRVVIDNNYDYDNALQKLATEKYYAFNTDYIRQQTQYAKHNNLQNSLDYQWSFLTNKRTKYNPITVESCQMHLKQLEEIIDYVRVNNGVYYFYEYESHKEEVEKVMHKLQKKRDRKKRMDDRLTKR